MTWLRAAVLGAVVVASGSASAADEAQAPTAAQEVAPPPDDASAEAEPIPEATAAQRARVRAGDSILVTLALHAPMLGMKSEWQIRTSVTAVQEHTCTVVTELVKGEPPAGLLPDRRFESQVPIVAVLGDETDLAPGESRAEESADEEGTVVLKTTITREPDETLDVNGEKLTCIVIKTVQAIAGQGTSESREWRCPERVPIDGGVKGAMKKVFSLPNGGEDVMSFTQRLDEWTRGKE